MKNIVLLGFKASKNPQHLSLGAISVMLISFSLGMSLIIGYIAARLISGAKTRERGRFPSIAFTLRGYKIHVHHWLSFASILAAALIFQFSVFTHEIFYGFLGGVVIQGITFYEDWRQVIKKEKQLS
ncbi:hypothetical protein IIA94_02945 [Patescibacteria group bacterium]|nr:hypothetical protein [Patescibacteria group bacterium]